MGLANIIDDIATHLTNQRARSHGSLGCVYRGPNETMCAVGCLIPDDVFDFNIMNTASAGILLADHNEVAAYMSAELPGMTFKQQAQMLNRLQEFHDAYHPTIERDEVVYPTYMGLVAQYSDDQELYEEISASLWIIAAASLAKGTFNVSHECN